MAEQIVRVPAQREGPCVGFVERRTPEVYEPDDDSNVSKSLYERILPVSREQFVVED